MMLHADGTPLHHVWTRWELAPSITVPLVVSAAVYARGVAVLWSRGRGRGIRHWEVASFGTGWLVLALALMSPLHAVSGQLFSAHMVQHELMMVVAAPLLVMGRPVVPFLWALPRDARTRVGRLSRLPARERAWSIVASPLDAWVLHAAVLWTWHLPALFEATLYSTWVHGLQHASFLGVALLYWWSVLRHHRSSYGAAVVSLFTTLVVTGALGALLTFARAAWYPSYAVRAAPWGFTALEDQQLAGLIMWIPASISYLVAGLCLVAWWMRWSETRVALNEGTAPRTAARPAATAGEAA